MMQPPTKPRMMTTPEGIARRLQGPRQYTPAQPRTIGPSIGPPMPSAGAPASVGMQRPRVPGVQTPTTPGGGIRTPITGMEHRSPTRQTSSTTAPRTRAQQQGQLWERHGMQWSGSAGRPRAENAEVSWSGPQVSGFVQPQPKADPVAEFESQWMESQIAAARQPPQGATTSIPGGPQVSGFNPPGGAPASPGLGAPGQPGQAPGGQTGSGGGWSSGWNTAGSNSGLAGADSTGDDTPDTQGRATDPGASGPQTPTAGNINGYYTANATPEEKQSIADANNIPIEVVEEMLADGWGIGANGELMDPEEFAERNKTRDTSGGIVGPWFDEAFEGFEFGNDGNLGDPANRNVNPYRARTQRAADATAKAESEAEIAEGKTAADAAFDKWIQSIMGNSNQIGQDELDAMLAASAKQRAFDLSRTTEMQSDAYSRGGYSPEAMNGSMAETRQRSDIAGQSQDAAQRMQVAMANLGARAQQYQQLGQAYAARAQMETDPYRRATMFADAQRMMALQQDAQKDMLNFQAQLQANMNSGFDWDRFASNALPVIGGLAGMAFGGPAGAGIGSGVGGMFSAATSSGLRGGNWELPPANMGSVMHTGFGYSPTSSLWALNYPGV